MDRRNTDSDKIIRDLEAHVAELQAEVERLSIDAVTGIAGRGVLERAMETDFARSKRTFRPMAVAILDIDFFKRVNDDFGHQVGDEILHEVAQTVQGFVRGADTLARYGGEEFVILSDGTNPAGVAILAEKVRAAVESMNLDGAPLVTISVGWSIQLDEDASASDILTRADAALYRAKDGGRNQVEEG